MALSKTAAPKAIIAISMASMLCALGARTSDELFGTSFVADSRAAIQKAVDTKAPSDKVAGAVYAGWQPISDEGEAICNKQKDRKYGEPMSTAFRDFVIPAQDDLDAHIEDVLGNSYDVAEHTRFKCNASTGEIYAEQLGFEYGGWVNPTFCYHKGVESAEGLGSDVLTWSCESRFGSQRRFDTVLLESLFIASSETDK
jgi:hypothetical protein